MTQQTRPAKILIVDDRPENLLALEAVLEPLQLDVRRADSGVHALKALLTEEFAIILLDVQMPGMDGFETATLIKARDKTKTIPIIFITAIDRDLAYLRQGYTVGAVDYLAKPVDPDMLRSKVQIFVDLHLKELQIKEQAELIRQTEQRELERIQEARERELVHRHEQENVKAAAELGQFMITLDAALDAICIFEPDSLKFIYANQGASHTLNYSKDELMQLTPADVIADEYRKSFEHLLGPLLTGEIASQTLEIAFKTKAEKQIAVETFLQVIRQPNLPSRCLLIARDITDRKKAQNDLAMRYEREKRIAEVLQTSLLLSPTELDIPNVDVAPIYEAAWDEAQLGGDFYDVFTLENGKVALVVGDITGKGLAAAAKTAEIKYALRAFMRETPQPADVLTRLNAVLCDSISLRNPNGIDSFVCIAVAVLDPNQNTAAFAVGGIEPPFIVREDGTCDIVDASGLPLGISAVEAYATFHSAVNPGDTIVFVTDGVTEAKNKHDLFGFDRLTECAVAHCASSSPQDLGNIILAAAHEFAGDKLHDDACILIARRTTSESTNEQSDTANGKQKGFGQP